MTLFIGLLVGCGAGEPETDVVALTTGPRAHPADGADPTVAGTALRDLGFDLLEAASSPEGGNVVVSPASIGVALAMLEPGATGEAQSQLRQLLRIQDPETFHASMNALEQTLEEREPEAPFEDEDPGELTLRVANAAYIQQGYPVRPDYLDEVGRHYGPALHAVDFSPDPDAVAREINRFVAEATNDRIPDLLSDGQLRSDTVLALVNALYLKASWVEVFDKSRTTPSTFTLPGGDEVRVPMMHGESAESGRGDGWVAASKTYVGGMAVEFILPDEGRFDEVAARYAEVVAEFEGRRTKGARLVLPRFETRFKTDLRHTFDGLGFTAAYQPGNLLGIADDPRLVLDVAAHETFLAMDEEGTEAAASTALAMYPVSGPPFPPVPVVLDRPFLFRVHDWETEATLFLGRILDPRR